ncbi:hypothetical protein Ae201684_003450 [Aphanomyces euteiches]|uniref:Uncharacterized protein n=1 Tax=Aphanomyces euteiches TaxID=100861 RepID=A0A6G0XM89_9STRA|nr:hypothetical protein Ae201684_003450 [Aphanomyces euteiches]
MISDHLHLFEATTTAASWHYRSQKIVSTWLSSHGNTSSLVTARIQSTLILRSIFPCFVGPLEIHMFGRREWNSKSMLGVEILAWFLVEQWYISLHISQINREATPSYSSVIDWSDNIVSRIVCLNIVLSHALLTESHFPMSTPSLFKFPDCRFTKRPREQNISSLLCGEMATIAPTKNSRADFSLCTGAKASNNQGHFVKFT